MTHVSIQIDACFLFVCIILFKEEAMHLDTLRQRSPNPRIKWPNWKSHTYNPSLHFLSLFTLITLTSFTPITLTKQHTIPNYECISNKHMLLFAPRTIESFPDLCFLQKLIHPFRIQAQNSLIHRVRCTHFIGWPRQSKSEWTLRGLIDSQSSVRY